MLLAAGDSFPRSIAAKGVLISCSNIWEYSENKEGSRRVSSPHPSNPLSSLFSPLHFCRIRTPPILRWEIGEARSEVEREERGPNRFFVQAFRREPSFDVGRWHPAVTCRLVGGWVRVQGCDKGHLEYQVQVSSLPVCFPGTTPSTVICASWKRPEVAGDTDQAPRSGNHPVVYIIRPHPKGSQWCTTKTELLALRQEGSLEKGGGGAACLGERLGKVENFILG